MEAACSEVFADAL